VNRHLSDEQLSELLYGCSPIDACRHLLTCDQCSAELKRLQACLNDFASLGLAWADNRAAVSISAPSALVRNWHAVSTAAAAAVVLAAAVLFSVHPQSSVQVPATAAVAGQPAAFGSDIAADDQLMKAIDTEIRRQTESAVSNAELSGVHFVTEARTPRSRPTHRLTN
jgi:hypothetical protein